MATLKLSFMIVIKILPEYSALKTIVCFMTLPQPAYHIVGIGKGKNKIFTRS